MIKSITQLNSSRACLFTDHAELIWRSPKWTKEEGDEQVIGARWHEYIAPDDYEYVLRWVASDGLGEPCVFRFMFPPTGKWFCCIWSKRKWRGLWLIVGDVLEVAGVPAPPAPLLDHPEECECESKCACGGVVTEE